MLELAKIIWVVSFLISVVIGTRKGNPIGGASLGYLLGPLGAIIVLLSGNKNRKACPYCADKKQKKAILCPHYNKDVVNIW